MNTMETVISQNDHISKTCERSGLTSRPRNIGMA